MARPSKLTPMLEQYFEIKRQVPDAILFYRLGDFYEMFFEDAEKAAPLLDLVLTARNKGQDYEAPMCGVPYHSADGYIAKLRDVTRLAETYDALVMVDDCHATGFLGPKGRGSAAWNSVARAMRLYLALSPS